VVVKLLIVPVLLLIVSLATLSWFCKAVACSSLLKARVLKEGLPVVVAVVCHWVDPFTNDALNPN